MKLVSWNVNGIRASIKKGFLDSVQKMNPDILCLQETKAEHDQIKEALGDFSGYHLFTHSAVKKGYSGTAIFSKVKPLAIQYGMGIEVHDQEGRVITAEFEKYYVVTVYTPNSSQDLKRLPYRKGWDTDFKNYIKKLEEHKPVIACGDFNVAHQPIDLARPKANYNKTAGYTQDEIDGLTNFINAGLVDSFRHLHPDKVAYSWWSYRAGAKENNVGWRLDYFFLSQSIIDQLHTSEIHPDFGESDHCPVSITLKA